MLGHGQHPRSTKKKPEHRFHSAHDLGFALEALSSPNSSSGSELNTASSAVIAETPSSTWSSRLPWIAAAAFALVAVGALLFIYVKSSSSTSATAARLSFNPPPNLSFNDVQQDAAVISPDGQKIAFSATSTDGKSMLYVRNLNSSDATLLPGSDNAIEPFWSPDSRSVAYGSNGKLRRSDLAGGNAQVLCDAARVVGGEQLRRNCVLAGLSYAVTAGFLAGWRAGSPALERGTSSGRTTNQSDLSTGRPQVSVSQANWRRTGRDLGRLT
ncbi:MAG: hypothetical protein DMF69_04670 [Acidobacteria bacterium]|nr:MAG: hypothetical protein DMF69_04670 [Acidobacteriota bacterium]